MQKDGRDRLSTVPPPAEGDAYAAETVISRAPVDVLAMLKGPTTEGTFAADPDTVETVVLAPRSGIRTAAPEPPVTSDSAIAPGSRLSPDSAVTSDSTVARGSAVKSWIFPALATALICVLMFLLGRLL